MRGGLKNGIARGAVLLCVHASSLFAAESSLPSRLTQPKTTPQGASAPKGQAKGGGFYGSAASGEEKDGRKNVGGKTSTGPASRKDEEGGAPGMSIPAAAVTDAGEQKLMPEITMKALLSASDVNRFVCSGEIKDVTWSKEKGVQVKYSGRNAFVKFNVMKAGDRIEYPTKPVEFFISCGGSIYNVIGVPKRIVSQTIRLTSGKEENIRKNASLHAGQSFERLLLSLIRAAYTDEIPDSYSVEQKEDEVRAFRDMDCILKRTISVEGEGFVVREYHLTPKVEESTFSERDFLDMKFAANPVAIAADRLRLARGETARVFVVDAKEAAHVERP